MSYVALFVVEGVVVVNLFVLFIRVMKGEVWNQLTAVQFGIVLFCVWFLLPFVTSPTGTGSQVFTADSGEVTTSQSSVVKTVNLSHQNGR